MIARLLTVAACACATAGCASGLVAFRDLGRGPGCEPPTGLGSGVDRRGSSVGDVDGDGRRDRVAVLARYEGRAGCRFFLVVRLAIGPLLAARLADPYVDASADDVRDSLYPRLSAVAAIDRFPGLEFLVTLDQSASGGAVGVFSVRAGRIVRLGGPRTRFWSFGHNYYAGAADCVGRLVVSTSAEREAPDWKWTAHRTFLRAEGTTFRRVRVITARARSLDRFPEFRPDSLWFRDCPGFRLAVPG